MYKRDYHPDENIVFKTKNYGFDAPKSTPLEPLSNALVQIDAALKTEETERTAEDIRINGRVDKEIADRESADNSTNARFLGNRASNILVSEETGGCFGTLCVAQKIDNVISITISGNMYGTFDLPLSKFIGNYTLIDDYGSSGSAVCVIPDSSVAGRYAKVFAIGGANSLSIFTGMANTSDSSKAIPISFTTLLGIKS